MITSKRPEAPLDIELRVSTAHDSLEDIAAVYVKSWQYAYKNILDDSFLEGLSVEDWMPRLASSERHMVVALHHSVPVGVVSFGAARDAYLAGWGELYSIYMLPTFMHQGIGERLLKMAQERFGALGLSSYYLWVLERNVSARHFYEHEGLSCSGESRRVAIGDQEVTELRYSQTLPLL